MSSHQGDARIAAAVKSPVVSSMLLEKGTDTGMDICQTIGQKEFQYQLDPDHVATFLFYFIILMFEEPRLSPLGESGGTSTDWQTEQPAGTLVFRNSTG